MKRVEKNIQYICHEGILSTSKSAHFVDTNLILNISTSSSRTLFVNNRD